MGAGASGAGVASGTDAGIGVATDKGGGAAAGGGVWGVSRVAGVGAGLGVGADGGAARGAVSVITGAGSGRGGGGVISAIATMGIGAGASTSCLRRGFFLRGGFAGDVAGETVALGSAPAAANLGVGRVVFCGLRAGFTGGGPSLPSAPGPCKAQL